MTTSQQYLENEQRDFVPLTTYSRQLLQVDSTMRLVGADEKPRSGMLTDVSVKLRIAEALEKQTAIMERLHPEPQQHNTVAPEGHKISANWIKGSPGVSVHIHFSSPEKAEAFFESFGTQLKQAVDSANEQEGGQTNA